MKIVMFTTDYLPSVGGVAAHVYELARATREAGHEVAVVTNVQDADGAGSVDPLPRVLRVSDRIRLLPITRGRRLQFAVNMVRPMLGELRGFDVLHFHTVDPLACTLSLIWTQQPQIATNHTSMFVSDAGDPRRVVPWERFFRRMDGIIAPSEELADLTAAVTGKAERVRYIPNGVDASRFHPDVSGRPCRERYGIRPDEPLILCPRRLVKKNGCIFLARAMRAVIEAKPSARLLFAGEGPERQNVERALDKAACLDRTVFAGSIPNSDMPAVYAAADVVVIPSLVEATSISALEAMAAARPVVASRTGGLPALVENANTGCLVEPGDESGLAAALCDLLADPNKRTQMGAAARRRVLREFTWDRVAAATISACQSFLACSHREVA